MLYVFWKEQILIIFMIILQSLFRLLGPWVIAELVKYFEEGSSDYWVAYRLLGVIVFQAIVEVTQGNYMTLQ